MAFEVTLDPVVTLSTLAGLYLLLDRRLRKVEQTAIVTQTILQEHLKIARDTLQAVKNEHGTN